MPNFLKPEELFKSMGIDLSKHDVQNPAEATSLQQLYDAKSAATITIETWRKFVHDHKNAVEHELVNPEIGDKRKAHLLAVLDVMIFFESYFDSSEYALKYIKEKIETIEKKS